MKLHIYLIAAVALTFASCATQKASYSPPLTPPLGKVKWTRTLDLPFDEVWERLVDHTSGTFFAIDNFEKDSGLMTLTFGSSQISPYVRGGTWRMKATAGYNALTGQRIGSNLDFEGDYAEFLDLYRETELDGKMNIFVRDLGAGKTEVKVRARYIVTSTSITTAGQVRTTWSFDTGSQDTESVRNPADGTDPARTMMPTYKAENSILNALDAMSS